MEAISASRAKWLLREYLKSRIFWTRKIILLDGQYELVDESELELQPIPPLPKGADCDDLAFIQFADVIRQHPTYMFGVCEGYNKEGLRHAWCYFISKHTHTFKQKGIRGYSKSLNTVKYVEPRTAETFLPSTEKVYMFIR